MATSTVESQQGFAPVIEPFATNVLGAAEALTSNTDNPYQRYTGDQVAGYSPLQQQSYNSSATMQTAPQLADATALAGQAGLGALNTQYSYMPSGFGQAFSAANTKDAQGNITGNTMMNPFTGVMDSAARRNASISQQGMQAQAANAGGFGGARDYINRNQGNADLQRNLGQNQFNAYNQAQQQYNTQYGQNAQQQQFGANLGMQGLGLANQSAQGLGALGQTQYAQNVGTIGLQNQMGGQQQQQAQNVMNANYQNWAAEQNDPYKRLGFMSDIVRGAPLTQTGSSVYSSGPSSIENLASLGMGAYGLNSLFGGKKAKNGGLTQAYANGGMVGYDGGGMVGYDGGGSVMSPQFKQYAVDHIDPRQLPMAQQNAQARGDMETYQAVMQKMAEDAALRRGIANAVPPGTDMVRAAGGGILAFQDGELVSAENTNGGAGNLSVYNEASLKALASANEIKNLVREGYTPTQINKIIEDRFNLDKRLMGGDEYYKSVTDYIDKSDTDRAETMRQGHGLTALRASAALQKAGVTSGDRWGGALSSIADSEEKLRSADTAQKDAMAKFKFNVADMRRKENAGLVKDATSAAVLAQQNIKDAYTANVNSHKAAGDIYVNVAKANKPPSGANKLQANDREAAKLSDKIRMLRSKNPNDSQIPLLQSQLEGRLIILGIGKDFGPIKGDIEKNKLEEANRLHAHVVFAKMDRYEKKAYAKKHGITLDDAHGHFVKNYRGEGEGGGENLNSGKSAREPPDNFVLDTK